MSDDAPADEAYACHLTDEAEAREQRARLEALLDAAGAVEEIDDGLRIELPREGGIAGTAADFAVLESRCCPWARYELTFERGRERVVLEVTGDERAAELVQQYPTGEVPEGLEGPDLS